MKRTAKATGWVVSAMLLGAAVTGCSNNSGSSSSSATPSSTGGAASSAAGHGGSAAPSGSAATGTATLDLHSNKLGPILVDAGGRTLYLFEADHSSHSTCYGACAAALPPLLTSGTPKAGSGVKSSLISTSKRSNGATQVVYNGHPLYRFSGDTKPGDTTGQDSKAFGAALYVVSASGSKVGS